MKLGSQNSAVNVVQHRCKCFVVICKITAGKTPFVAIRPHLVRVETPSLVDVVCRNDESKKSKPGKEVVSGSSLSLRAEESLGGPVSANQGYIGSLYR